jgi:hypothetical protein
MDTPSFRAAPVVAGLFRGCFCGSKKAHRIWKAAGCATLLSMSPLMAGCATTTKATDADNTQNSSVATYSGGGPTSSTLEGPAYYQSDENPFHSD